MRYTGYMFWIVMFWLLLALLVSMIHIMYTSALCKYLLPYFIIYACTLYIASRLDHYEMQFDPINDQVQPSIYLVVRLL